VLSRASPDHGQRRGPVGEGFQPPGFRAGFSQNRQCRPARYFGSSAFSSSEGAFWQGRRLRWFHAFRRRRGGEIDVGPADEGGDRWRVGPTCPLTPFSFRSPSVDHGCAGALGSRASGAARRLLSGVAAGRCLSGAAGTALLSRHAVPYRRARLPTDTPDKFALSDTSDRVQDAGCCRSAEIAGLAGNSSIFSRVSSQIAGLLASIDRTEWPTFAGSGRRCRSGRRETHAPSLRRRQDLETTRFVGSEAHVRRS
jgi:hypothetical protein